MATSKSWLIPIESTGSATPSRALTPSRISRRRAKYGRTRSACSKYGGTPINPRSFTCVIAANASASVPRSPSPMPDFEGSSLIRTSISAGRRFSRAAASKSSARASGKLSTASIR